MSAAAAADLERGRALLRRAGRAGASATAVHPTAAELGADAGEAYLWEDVDVVARIYAFPTSQAALDALDMLRATVGDAGNGAANGALMLWATAGSQDEEAEDFIDELRSALAGRER